MSWCDACDAFVERELSGSELRAFEAHLRGCQSCRAEVAKYRADQAAAHEWLEARVPLTIESKAARSAWRVANARAAQRHASRRRWLVGAGVALPAAALLAFFLLVSGPGQPPPPEPPPLLVHRLDGTVERSGSSVAGTELDTRQGGRLLAELGQDRIGLARRSRATIVDASATHRRIRLHSGTVVVAARRRARSEAFIVEAGGFEIRVVGTRFSVAHDEARPLEVQVSEGSVEISGLRGKAERVRAGEAIAVDRAANVEWSSLGNGARDVLHALLEVPRTAAPATEPGRGPRPEPKKTKTRRKQRQPSHDDWLQWIVAGEYARTELSIRDHLRRQEGDTRARMLLADCLRKAGKHEQAVVLYQRLAHEADAVLSNKARLLAAEISQTNLADHPAAIRLLRTYLRQPQRARPLEASAMLRLARSLLAVGKDAEAKRMLEEIVERHPTSSAAGGAKSLLKTTR
jgi:tetratricopeptide (TPR) repeat protein